MDEEHVGFRHYPGLYLAIPQNNGNQILSKTRAYLLLFELCVQFPPVSDDRLLMQQA